MNYSIKKKVDYSFKDTILKAKTELAKEGFGILTEVNVKETLKNKLDVEWDNYIILGACNPSLAYEALKNEKEIGLFLPCNVIVYEDEGNVYVSAILPTTAMQMVENETLTKVSKEAESKFRKIIDLI